MAFSPAWGGVIPLVPIGSFRGFLGQRRKGKELNQWYTGVVTRLAVAAALRTATGRRAAQNVTGILRLMGFKGSSQILAVELKAYIAFQKFEYGKAVRRKNDAEQRRIEGVMFAPGGKIVVSDARPAGQVIPQEFLKMLADRPPPLRGVGRGDRPFRLEDIENPAVQAFAIWFERRKRRKGRFVNV